MTEPYIVEIGFNGTVVTFRHRPLDQTTAPNSLGSAVHPHSITLLQLEELRLGNLQSAIIEEIKNKLREWTATSLSLALEREINNLSRSDPNEVLPVVFSYNSDLPNEIAENLADLPWELLAPNSARPSLAIDSRVAVSYYPGHISKAGVRAGNGSNKLRVLLVRSSPIGMEEVPKAALLYEELDQLAKNSQIPMEINVLSSEEGNPPGVIGRPTQKQLEEHANQNYDILLYLGHGDRDAQFRKPPAFGLVLENSRGGPSHVFSDTLAQIIGDAKIPIVILVSCWSASTSGILSADGSNKEYRLRRMRANQGLAQALIASSNTRPTIKITVGMRTHIDSVQAKTFIVSFFGSLIGKKNYVGHVQAAICAARRALHDPDQLTYGWVAPMLFTTLPSEPFLHFMQVSEEVNKVRTDRFNAWIEVAERPIDVATLGNIVEPLKVLDTKLFALSAAKVVTLWVDPVKIIPGGAEFVEIGLHGGKHITSLRFTVSVVSLHGSTTAGGETARIVEVNKLSESISLSGDLQSTNGSAQATFTVESRSTDPLPDGAIIKVRLKAAQNPRSTVAILRVDLLEVHPHTGFYPVVDNIIIVQ